MASEVKIDCRGQPGAVKTLIKGPLVIALERGANFSFAQTHFPVVSEVKPIVGLFQIPDVHIGFGWLRILRMGKPVIYICSCLLDFIN